MIARPKAAQLQNLLSHFVSMKRMKKTFSSFSRPSDSLALFLQVCLRNKAEGEKPDHKMLEMWPICVSTSSTRRLSFIIIILFWSHFPLVVLKRRERFFNIRLRRLRVHKRKNLSPGARTSVGFISRRYRIKTEAVGMKRENFA